MGKMTIVLCGAKRERKEGREDEEVCVQNKTRKRRVWTRFIACDKREAIDGKISRKKYIQRDMDPQTRKMSGSKQRVMSVESIGARELMNEHRENTGTRNEDSFLLSLSLLSMSPCGFIVRYFFLTRL